MLSRSVKKCSQEEFITRYSILSTQLEPHWLGRRKISCSGRARPKTCSSDFQHMGESSWLPNQMISLISMFGFLCRSIPIPKSQMIEKNRMYSNVLGGVTTNNKQSHRSDSIPFETRYFYSHIASVVIFCRHIVPFFLQYHIFISTMSTNQNNQCFTSPILPGRWAKQDGSTWSDACHHTKRSGHQKRK